jgi:general secretion pathway protein D
MTDGEDSVPVLGDIPVLGHLFRYNSRTQKKTNLMVFLRPQIVRTAAEAEAVTSPRYDYILGQEKASAPSHHPMLPEMSPPMLRDDMRPGGGGSGKITAPAGTATGNASNRADAPK